MASNHAEGSTGPSGSSPALPSVSPAPAGGSRSGSSWSEVGQALKTIRPVEDLKNVGSIPCGRDSLLYGIGGGVGIGCLRYLSSSNPRVAGNWAVGSFMLIAIYQWEACRGERKRQEEKLKVLSEKYPHRHVSNLTKGRPNDENSNPS
ncbi:hypothetical protein BD324DRAFT_623102 [Kockovaella imperatae]|uniref:Cytochrome c oxidase assembly protein COX20, mitochondrial n=1 Tax=Kockovaella imperatae TaxID=4999 RepID=A0A1Y1UI60_9TREE|nr:hypothetical protein BD324DRAFT_623102 [Kockovaella imperatae]ORX37741.1 hypothetical protein BD324DRAFT_623102 [Kockovaella imperatae]